MRKKQMQRAIDRMEDELRYYSKLLDSRIIVTLHEYPGPILELMNLTLEEFIIIRKFHGEKVHLSNGIHMEFTTEYIPPRTELCHSITSPQNT